MTTLLLIRHGQSQANLHHLFGGQTDYALTELASRIERVLTAIAERNPGKTLAIATHAIPIRSIQWRLSGQPLSHMAQIPWVTNASVTELFYEDGIFHLGKIAQDEHLESLKTNLPANV